MWFNKYINKRFDTNDEIEKGDWVRFLNADGKRMARIYKVESDVYEYHNKRKWVVKLKGYNGEADIEYLEKVDKT